MDNEVPRCYRHPDRETRITCTRCDRPICTECMIAAPVGYRCPECMNTGQLPTPKTVAGSELIGKPRVTYALIAINLVIFVFQYLIGINELASEFGLKPREVALNGEWWRLLTSAFLHGSEIHIAFNMLILFLLGPTLERILGHIRFLILYIMSAFGGAVASYWFSNIEGVSIGASGAIFGLMGALIVAGRRLRYDVTQVLILLGVNVAIGFLSPSVDWRAHFGGLAAGAVVAAIMVFPPKKYRKVIQVVGVSGVLLILVALTMVRTTQIQEIFAPIMGVPA